MLSNIFLMLPIYIWIIADMESRGLTISSFDYTVFVSLAGFILLLRVIKKVVK
jgi:hypothetical protein